MSWLIITQIQIAVENNSTMEGIADDLSFLFEKPNYSLGERLLCFLSRWCVDSIFLAVTQHQRRQNINTRCAPMPLKGLWRGSSNILNLSLLKTLPMNPVSLSALVWAKQMPHWTMSVLIPHNILFSGLWFDHYGFMKTIPNLGLVPSKLKAHKHFFKNRIWLMSFDVDSCVYTRCAQDMLQNTNISLLCQREGERNGFSSLFEKWRGFCGGFKRGRCPGMWELL